MALTINNLVRHNFGDGRLHVGTIAFDNSYASGGESLTAAMLGLYQLESISFDNTAGYVPVYDFANSKVIVYRSAPAGTVAQPTFTVNSAGAIGTNMEIGLSASTNTATVEGGTGITGQIVLTTTSPVGTPTFTGTASALTEVTAAVDLSTALAAVKFRAFGR